jgi:hypothetical protein
MLVGYPPFKGTNEYQTFQLITNRTFAMPNFLSSNARNIVDRLLVNDETFYYLSNVIIIRNQIPPKDWEAIHSMK